MYKRQDPYETHDLREEKPEVVAGLVRKLEDWKKTLPEKPSGNVFSAERAEL